ncbi:hypothetical protein GCM10027059_49810 [Myceligenerans halotolerans]
MSEADRNGTAVEPATIESSVAGGPAETAAPPAGAPVFSMLADDGAACVDGVCALPVAE